LSYKKFLPTPSKENLSCKNLTTSLLCIGAADWTKMLDGGKIKNKKKRKKKKERSKKETKK